MSLPDVTTESTSPQTQLRKVATWLIGAFAVVGATASGSLSLKSLSDMPADRTLQVVAGAGFLLAMAGIAWAIVAVSRVLTPMIYRESDAREDLKDAGSTLNARNVILFPVTCTPKGSLDLIDSSLDVINSTDQNKAAQKGGALQTFNEESARFKEWMNQRALEKLQDRYVTARWQSVLAAFLIAIGLLAYAFSVATPTSLDTATRLKALDNREAAITKRESELALNETKTGLIAGFPRAGTWKPSAEVGKCPKDTDIPVVVNRLEKTDGFKAYLVTSSTSTCPNMALEVTSEEGSLTIPETTWKMP